MPTVRPEQVPEAIDETTDWILHFISPDRILEYPEKKYYSILAAIIEHVGKYYGKNEGVARLIVEKALLAAKEKLRKNAL